MTDNTISYAVTVSDEIYEIKRLIPILLKEMQCDDELIILYDINSESLEVLSYLNDAKSRYPDLIKVYSHKFDGDFSKMKNLLNSYCKNNYIFQIDSDEIPSQDTIKFIKGLPQKSPDLIRLPRKNFITNMVNDFENRLTENELLTFLKSAGASHLRIFSDGSYSYPDYQGRIYKNSSEIFWIGHTHETIFGHRSEIMLPKNSVYDLLHLKTKDQTLQSWNTYY